MFRVLLNYASVYGQFIANACTLTMSFRTNFFLLVLVDIVFLASLVFGTSFIFDSVDIIGPWRKEQFLFFMAYVLTVDSLHMITISASFWHFSDDVRTGQIDYVLLKPVNSIFIIFFRHIRPTSLVGFITIFATLITFGLSSKLSVLSWILLPLLLLLSLFLLFVVEIIIAVSMFYIIDGTGVNFLRLQFNVLSRWPDFVYHYYYRRIFTTIFPLLLVGSPPVHFLLDNDNYKILMMPLVVLGLAFIIMVKLWNKGVKRYDSASS